MNTGPDNQDQQQEVTEHQINELKLPGPEQEQLVRIQDSQPRTRVLQNQLPEINAYCTNTKGIEKKKLGFKAHGWRTKEKNPKKTNTKPKKTQTKTTT